MWRLPWSAPGLEPREICNFVVCGFGKTTQRGGSALRCVALRRFVVPRLTRLDSALLGRGVGAMVAGAVGETGRGAEWYILSCSGNGKDGSDEDLRGRRGMSSWSGG